MAGCTVSMLGIETWLLNLIQASSTFFFRFACFAKETKFSYTESRNVIKHNIMSICFFCPQWDIKYLLIFRLPTSWMCPHANRAHYVCITELSACNCSFSVWSNLLEIQGQGQSMLSSSRGINMGGAPVLFPQTFNEIKPPTYRWV